MSKQGMKRPEQTHAKPRNTVPAVPELQGNMKTGKQKANPITPGSNQALRKKRPISPVYPAIDNDLARDNIENDLSAADLQDL